MLGTQFSNTVVAQQAHCSSCDSPPWGAGSWCNTSSRDYIIRTPNNTRLWCKSQWPHFGLTLGHLKTVYLWLVSHQLEFPLQLQHPLQLKHYLLFLYYLRHMCFFVFTLLKKYHLYYLWCVMWPHEAQEATGKLKVIASVMQNICHLACHVYDLFRVSNDSMMIGQESKEVKRKSFPLIWTKASATSFYLTANAEIQCVGSCLGFVKIPQNF